MSVTRSVSVLIVLGLVLVSCGRDAATGLSPLVAQALKEAEAAGADEQAAMLRDGVVTKAEYEQTFVLEARCDNRPPPRLRISPVDNLRMLILGPVRTGSDCSRRMRAFVESIYVATNRPRMDPAVRKEILACLRRAGGSTDESWMTLREMSAGLGDRAGEALGRCVLPSVQKFYPEIESLGFSE